MSLNGCFLFFIEVFSFEVIEVVRVMNDNFIGYGGLRGSIMMVINDRVFDFVIMNFLFNEDFVVVFVGYFNCSF